MQEPAGYMALGIRQGESTKVAESDTARDRRFLLTAGRPAGRVFNPASFR